jgi:4-amino-4-deoxy-L-arabinose transferase-like glycosyltransferase
MGGILATPDAAMTPFWVLTLWCLARTEGPNGRPWWIAAGVAAGLACLSKYSALFLAPGVIVWLVATPGGLARLKQPWPWLALVIAAAIFGLNVEWNATHHWLTFQKQFGRVAPHALKPGYVLELLAGQFLLLNPLIAIFAIQGARWPWKPAIPGRLDPTLLLSTSIPFAAYLAVHALHDRVQAHWPVPIYPALALVAAAVAQDATTGWRAGLRKAAAPVGLSLSALALIHLAVPGIGLKGVPDPSRAVRGWPVFISQVRQLQQTQQVGWIGTLSYGVDAQLSAQGVTGPIVELFERDRYPPSDSSWRADLSRPGLVIDIDRRTRDYDLSLCFNQVTPVANLSRGDGVVRPEYYQAFRVAGPRPDVLKDGCSAKPVRR